MLTFKSLSTTGLPNAKMIEKIYKSIQSIGSNAYVSKSFAFQYLLCYIFFKKILKDLEGHSKNKKVSKSSLIR